MFFSKSRYCDFCQCGKMVWLKKNRPEEISLDEAVLARMKAGNEVGDLAMGYFGDFTEVTKYKEDGKLDIPGMIEATDAELKKCTPVICEAAFSLNGLYCAVDILKSEDGGWAIYEVKSSTHNDSEVYMLDIAYQKYVLENCGVKVTGTYLICIDNTYVFDGTLDIKKLFKVTDVSEKVDKLLPRVGPDLKRAEGLLDLEEEPDIALGMHCYKPYECGFLKYCKRGLPEPNVFDLYRMSKKDMLSYYDRGIVSYEALERDGEKLTEIQKMQIDCALHDRGTIVDKENLREFLDGFSYPIYFLDFESIMPVVPKYVGTKPYAQVPFQYSLHYVEREGGPVEHKEFLAEPGTDPLRPIAEALCRDISGDGTVLVYNMTFEKGRIKELSRYFPDLEEQLMKIHGCIKDLVVPFREGWYYNSRMGGSFSIKSVLPAIFPDDPELDYHNLEGIHNGGEAMTIFPEMEKMSPEEQARTRENLLKYCGLDTLALVKVWDALREAAGIK